MSEICLPRSLDPICGKFDKFLAHGQAHMGQMGIWPWQCTPAGLDNSTELRMEKIRRAFTEIWVPQVWQPPARPPGPWRQYPSSPEGWGVKNKFNSIPIQSEVFYTYNKYIKMLRSIWWSKHIKIHGITIPLIETIMQVILETPDCFITHLVWRSRHNSLVAPRVSSCRYLYTAVP